MRQTVVSKKNRKMFRILLRVIVVLLLLLILAGAGIWGYTYSKDLAPKVTLPPEFPEGATAVLGNPVPFQMELFLPWHITIKGIDVVPGNGSVVSGPTGITSGKWELFGRNWTIHGQLTGYRTGEIPPGEIQLHLDNRNGNSQQSSTLSRQLPALKMEARVVDNTAPLALADLLDVPQRTNTWQQVFFVIILITLTACVIIAGFLLRKYRMQKCYEPPCWERAQGEIAALRRSLANRNADFAAGFGKLSDIVRSYLEERFDLTATRQTTGEFLRTLENENSPLKPEEKRYLRSFLHSADLVKFAREIPDGKILLPAIDHAEELVEHTRPQPEANANTLSSAKIAAENKRR